VVCPFSGTIKTKSKGKHHTPHFGNTPKASPGGAFCVGGGGGGGGGV